MNLISDGAVGNWKGLLLHHCLCRILKSGPVGKVNMMVCVSEAVEVGFEEVIRSYRGLSVLASSFKKSV